MAQIEAFKILGLPEKRQEEYVLFWRDMFDEAGVDVPQTWDEFVDVSEKLQEYYGTSNSDFMAIALGAKDEWPIYPLVENMPSAISGQSSSINALLLESVLLQSAFMLHLPSLRKASACVLPMAPVPIIAIPCISAS